LKKFEQTKDSNFKGSHTIGSKNNSGQQSDVQTPQQPKSRARLFLLVAGTLFIIFISVELIFHHGSSRESGGPSTKRVVSIQLEVLNGTTEPKVAQRLTEALRAGGFDVVDMGNYKSSSVSHTTVIGRTADKSAALSVASYLGVDKSRVLQKPDKNLYLDVSVIVGKDISQLRVFK
jgi:hypothetical protein